MNYTIDLNNTETFPRYVKVPYPYSQEVEEIHDIRKHIINDPEDDEYVLVEEEFLKKHVDENGRVSTHKIGPSYGEIAAWADEYERNVEEPLEFEIDLHETWEQGRNQYLLERENGDVKSIQEFMDKYGLE